MCIRDRENYYDLARAGEFEQLFGRLAIGQNPTPLHNQYLVMRWDFSVVDPQGSPEQVKQALHNHINNAVKSFALWYQDYLPEAIDVHPDDAIASFEAVLGVVKKHGHLFYLLIDEYDNFANEVLMGSGPAINMGTCSLCATSSSSACFRCWTTGTIAGPTR